MRSFKHKACWLKVTAGIKKVKELWSTEFGNGNFPRSMTASSADATASTFGFHEKFEDVPEDCQFQ